MLVTTLEELSGEELKDLANKVEKEQCRRNNALLEDALTQIKKILLDFENKTGQSICTEYDGQSYAIKNDLQEWYLDDAENHEEDY